MARAQGYEVAVRAWRVDIQALSADYELLRKHPAFPSADRKLQETLSRIMVEGPEYQLQRITEMVQSMTLDELKVQRARLLLSERYDALEARRRALETERQQLMAENDAIERDERRRTRTLQAIGTAATLQQQTLKPLTFPVNCTTQYLGGMAFTNCR
jgi:hypothetical protein